MRALGSLGEALDVRYPGLGDPAQRADTAGPSHGVGEGAGEGMFCAWVLLAVVDLPYAIIKRYLGVGRQIPDHAPDVAEQAAEAPFAMWPSSTGDVDA